jgi:hypothetical protein
VSAPQRTEERHIQHPGTGRLRLAYMRSWKPPRRGEIDFGPIENAVLDAHSRFGLNAVYYDPHQAGYLAQRLRKRGVRMVEVPFTARNKQNMARDLLEAFVAHQFSDIDTTSVGVMFGLSFFTR